MLLFQYNEYTDKDELKMRITASMGLGSNLELGYWDHSAGGVKNYSCLRWKKAPYTNEPRTAKVLKDVTTIEELLKHNQVKKLMQKKKTFHYGTKIVLDTKDRKVKEIRRAGKKRKIKLVSTYEYDESDNLIKSTFVMDVSAVKTKIQDDPKTEILYEYDDAGNKIKETVLRFDKSKTGTDKWVATRSNRQLYEYDDAGNKIKETRFDLINNTGSAKEWIATDSVLTKYNEQNQKIEEYSTISFKEPKTRTAKRWIYDEKNRLTNLIYYDENEEKTQETTYEYKNNGVIHKHSINHMRLKYESMYEPEKTVFKIESYNNE